MLYSTSPGPVASRDGSSSYYQVFPYDDDEQSVGNPPAADPYYADFMIQFAQQEAGTPLAAYVRQWLAQTGAAASADNYVAAIDSGGPSRPLSELPLDYYAPGLGYLYVKDGWGPKAESLNFELGFPTTPSASHLDSGSFQIERGGRWLTANTTGYDSMVTGYAGVGQAPIRSPLANNSVLVAGRGMADAYGGPDYVDGPPLVTRLETRPGYAFASVDLSKAYRAQNSAYPARDDNPAVKSVVRDFVYVRGLDALVVFDRIESATSGAAKTFLLHFPNVPSVQSGSALGTNGDQALRLMSLTPAGQRPVTIRVIDESANSDHDTHTNYQHRLEEETSGQLQSYLINVVQARDTSSADLAAGMTEDATSFTITLRHPTLGSAVIKLNKGMSSSGGAFGYAASGTPSSLTALTDSVQAIQVTDNGPVWR
jgi:hypothetical protein